MAMRIRSNESRRLDEAMVLLFHNQAALLAEQPKFSSEFREIHRSFTAIEKQLQELQQLKAIVLRHDRMLTELSQAVSKMQDAIAKLQGAIAKLPEAIRQKIGFKAK